MAKNNNITEAASASAAAAASVYAPIPVFVKEHNAVIVDHGVLQKFKNKGFSLLDLDQELKILIKWVTTDREDYVVVSSVTLDDGKRKRRTQSPTDKVVDITDSSDDDDDDDDYVGVSKATKTAGGGRGGRGRGGRGHGGRGRGGRGHGGRGRSGRGRSVSKVAATIAAESGRGAGILKETAGGRPTGSLFSSHTTMNRSNPTDMAEALILSKKKRATAVCFKRNDGTLVHEITVFTVDVVGTTGNDLLTTAVNAALEGRSRIFQLGADFDAAKDVIQYKFNGANPYSNKFQALLLETILDGEVDTVQILMSVTKNEDDFDANATISI